MPEENRPRLGRGLAALIGDATITTSAPAPEAARGVRRIPIEFLRPNQRNPRRSFDEEQLDSLADSIREKGVIQPILARPISQTPGAYEIIAGERRWRAAQKAGLHEAPVIVVEASDKEALELAIVENVQRADLNAIEESLGYEQLISEFQYTQADLARVIGKSRSHIANTLRLLKLPETTKRLVMEGALSAGHARALLAFENPEAMAQRSISEGLTVRDLEQLAQRDDGSRERPSGLRKQGPDKDPNVTDLERELSDLLGINVSIDAKGEAGRVLIRYSSLEQLDLVLMKLRK
jgi:ParB family transcriptional regulator, chromosome partitioning protein